MDNLKKLETILTEIEQVSESIIRKTIPILKKMSDDKNFLFNKIKAKYPSYSDKEINHRMKELSSELIMDAQSIKKELSKFVNYLLKIEPKSSNILTNAWLGDSYGHTGLQGLQLLLEDLRLQLNNCNAETLISKI